MDQLFANMQKAKKTDVQSLLKLLIDAKVIEASKEEEDLVRSLFDGVSDKANVTINEFKEIINKLAAEYNIDFNGIATQLAANSLKVLQDTMGNAVTGATAVAALADRSNGGSDGGSDGGSGSGSGSDSGQGLAS